MRPSIDPEARAILRLEILRRILSAIEHPASFSDRCGSRWVRVSSPGTLRIDSIEARKQLRILVEQGLVRRRSRLLFEELSLTVEGVKLVLQEDAEQGRARRLRLVQFINAETRGVPVMLAVEAIADALKLTPLRVGNDLEMLKDEGLVDTQWLASGNPWPTRARLTPRGVRVAEEGWPQTNAMGQSLHITGSHNQVAMGGRDVTQTVQIGGDHAELRRLLDEVKAALADLAEDEEDRQDREHAVGRLDEALAKMQPEQRPVQRAWERVVQFATVEGAIQGIDRLHRALEATIPYVAQWYDGPPPLPPGMMA